MDDVRSELAHDATKRTREGRRGAPTERRKAPQLDVTGVDVARAARDDDVAASRCQPLCEQADLHLHAARPTVRDDEEHTRRCRHVVIVARDSRRAFDSVLS